MNRRDQLICDLDSDDWMISVKAAKELRNFSGGAVVQALSQALHKKDLWLAYYTAESLGVLADPTSVQSLKEVLRDDGLEQELENEMRRLAEIGDAFGLAEFSQQFEGDIISLKAMILSALLAINTPEALAAIEEIGQKPSRLMKFALKDAYNLR